MPVPRLSARSTDRMQSVVETADAAVDGGTAPDAALAKAASAHALPLGHVPLVVRAFNTGRAVRQMAAGDAWQKAAAHPVATVEGVVGLLSEPAPAKAAAASDLSDYALPPDHKAPEPPRLPAYELPEPKAAKEAAAPPAHNRLSVAFKAAAVVDAAGRELAALPAGAYAAVKRAALRAEPEAAAFLYARLEATRPELAKKAAAKPDAAVPDDHPAVKYAAELAACRATYPPPEPEEAAPAGYAKWAEAGGRVWFRKLPTCPVTGRPLAPVAPKAAAEAPPGPAPLVADSPDYGKVAGFGKNFNSAFLGNFNAIKDMPYLGAPVRGLTPSLSGLEPTRNTGLEDRTRSGLKADLAGLEQQGAIQDLLADPRFAKADPHQVLATYRQLSSAAPQAMANSAIAGDLVHRQLQTGPLSAFDLKNLVDIEKSLAQIKNYSTEGTRQDNEDEGK